MNACYPFDEALEGNETSTSAVERAGVTCEDGALIFGISGVERPSDTRPKAADCSCALLGNGWGGSAHGDELRLSAEKRFAVRDIGRKERMCGWRHLGSWFLETLLC